MMRVASLICRDMGGCHLHRENLGQVASQTLKPTGNQALQIIVLRPSSALTRWKPCAWPNRLALRHFDTAYEDCCSVFVLSIGHKPRPDVAEQARLLDVEALARVRGEH